MHAPETWSGRCASHFTQPALVASVARWRCLAGAPSIHSFARVAYGRCGSASALSRAAIRSATMASPLRKCIDVIYSIASRNTDTIIINDPHFYYDRPAKTSQLYGMTRSRICGVYFTSGAKACNRKESPRFAPLVRGYHKSAMTSRSSSLSGRDTLVPRPFGRRSKSPSVGASRRPRIWYLAA